TPTWEIDQVWHCHILDTDKYAKDCDTLFGQFIHHFPYFGVRGENDRQAWYRAYALTQVLFRKHFGFELAADLKAVPADCEPLQIVHSTIDGSTEQSRPRVEFSLEEALRVWE
ncbi:hypothetical protein H6F43_00245, partial [Leptolyngbya sp. FACHB-36]|nr:hypothetical protein [Leptolyngbya sp. FACHB-36]